MREMSPEKRRPPSGSAASDAARDCIDADTDADADDAGAIDDHVRLLSDRACTARMGTRGCRASTAAEHAAAWRHMAMATTDRSIN